MGLARDQKNLVTPTGRVLDLPGERTVYDLIRKEARFLGEGRFASLTLRKPTWSWKQMIDDENLFTRFADVVHGAYRHYDWTDLLVIPHATGCGVTEASIQDQE